MLFSVVPTHSNGVRLTRDQIRSAEPTTGRLTVAEWHNPETLGRSVRIARLAQHTGYASPDVIPPLFDPSMVRMTASGFLLIGYALNLVDCPRLPRGGGCGSLKKETTG